MRRCLALAALIAVMLTAAACGTHTQTTITHTATATTTLAASTTTATATTQVCAPSDATMNCVLQGLPAPPPRYGVAPGQSWGLDFGWSGVSAQLAKAQGATFGASYLSPDLSKNWSLALVNAYHAAGLKTVAVWESSATRAEQGYSAGHEDALRAKALAAALGNTNRPIDFAIDCDCTGSSIAQYFLGAHSVLGDRVNAYGGYDQIHYLYYSVTPRPIGNQNWQTYAWSGGRWLPASVAPLEQYLNGSLYDHDKAIAADYGQWPYTAPKPPNPHHYDWLPNTRRAFKVGHHTVHARERLAVQTWDRDKCRTPVKRKICRTARAHLQLLAGRISFIARHTGKRLKHNAKHPRWGATHYRVAKHRTTLGGAYQQFVRRTSNKRHGVVTAW